MTLLLLRDSQPLPLCLPFLDIDTGIPTAKNTHEVASVDIEPLPACDDLAN